ncbi:MAG: hypothetical protein KDA96_18195 [Planctomycetaceae bacterium]|nr:hypothetical protein [Planctomycetaceae bacterium]
MKIVRSRLRNVYAYLQSSFQFATLALENQRALAMESSGNNFSQELRKVTTLLDAEIQLLKAGEYHQVISRVRPRITMMMMLAVPSYMDFVHHFQNEWPGQTSTVGTVTFVQHWGRNGDGRCAD